jgi:hypothetical protein
MKAKKKYFDEECWRQKLNTITDDSPIYFVAEYIIPADHDDYDFIAVGRGRHGITKEWIKRIYVRLKDRLDKEKWDEMKACEIFNAKWHRFAVNRVPGSRPGYQKIIRRVTSWQKT